MSTDAPGAVMGAISNDVKKRFSAKWRLSDSGCHEWTACLLPNGYGAMQVAGRKVSAHRLSWVINFGEIPVGLCVLHRCDNRKCVNPNHLFIGTHKDNNDDMRMKGRGPDVSGKKNPAFKLSDQLRAQILAAYEDHGRRISDIAKQFSVCVGTVRKVAGVNVRSKHGKLNPKAKLTADIATRVRSRRAAGAAINAIAREEGLSWPTVKRIIDLESYV